MALSIQSNQGVAIPSGMATSWYFRIRQILFLPFRSLVAGLPAAVMFGEPFYIGYFPNKTFFGTGSLIVH